MAHIGQKRRFQHICLTCLLHFQFILTRFVTGLLQILFQLFLSRYVRYITNDFAGMPVFIDFVCLGIYTNPGGNRPDKHFTYKTTIISLSADNLQKRSHIIPGDRTELPQIPQLLNRQIIMCLQIIEQRI